MLYKLTFFWLLLITAQAAPLHRCQDFGPGNLHRRGCQSADITAEQILQFAQGSETCDLSSEFADECRTVDQATPFINAAFREYGICSVGERAALASLMAFESGNFQFERNHFPAPGNPGQGTRNLMTFPFVLQYAQEAAPNAQGSVVDQLLSSSNVPTDDQAAALSLVLPDNLSFASAAWFLKKSGQCSQDIVDGLAQATMEGWEAYITQCVGTTVTDDRRQVYLNALTALSG